MAIALHRRRHRRGLDRQRGEQSPGLLHRSSSILASGVQPVLVSGTSNAGDQYGHGTHIAGLIAGDGVISTGIPFSKTFMGIAPGAQIVNLRVLDANGAATDSQVIAAINQAVSLKSKYNIRVMNLSLGRGVYESYKLDPLCQAVEKAWKNGIVVVVAAGNNGRISQLWIWDGHLSWQRSIRDHGRANETYGKTPQRTDDLIASYSSKGPTLIDHVVKPDIVAPGNLLISTETPGTTLYATDTSNLVRTVTTCTEVVRRHRHTTLR